MATHSLKLSLCAFVCWSSWFRVWAILWCHPVVVCAMVVKSFSRDWEVIFFTFGISVLLTQRTQGKNNTDPRPLCSVVLVIPSVLEREGIAIFPHSSEKHSAFIYYHSSTNSSIRSYLLRINHYAFWFLRLLVYIHAIRVRTNKTCCEGWESCFMQLVGGGGLVILVRLCSSSNNTHSWRSTSSTVAALFSLLDYKVNHCRHEQAPA